MTKHDKNALIAAVRSVAPTMTAYPNMAVLEPRGRMLRAVYLEDARDPRACYVWAFVQPLFEEPPFVVAFNAGFRLGGPSRTFTLADTTELAACIRESALPYLDHAATLERYCAWEVVATSRDPYILRDRALALTACRRYQEAVEVFDRICALEASPDWMLELQRSAAELRGLVQRTPDAAHELLDAWENANIAALGLSPECASR